MVTLNRAAWVLFPLATIVVGGCNENGSGSATTAAPPATTAAAQASVRATAAVSAATPPPTASAEAMKPEHAFLRGPAGMLFAAARDAGLKDDQKATIEKLEQSLRASTRSTRPCWRTRTRRPRP
jgi:Spy/CpxP family protein refolding chaperone